jgi:hypothetical protein
MKEIAPGVWHWTALHQGIGAPVHSYYLADEGAIIDPMEPEGGVEAVGRISDPRVILLTNRHHYRASGKFRQKYGVPVRCHRAGMHEFTKGEEVEPFEFGDRFPGDVAAVEVGALCPEETAFTVEREGGIVSLGDSVVQWGPDAPLGFVPEEHLGDDPEAVRRGLRESLAKIAARPFEILLLAHGEPVVGGGSEALRAALKA